MPELEEIVEGIDLGSIVLDVVPALNGRKKTQDEWFDYWSNVDDGRVMASMGDLYLAFKELKDKYENGSDSDKSKAKQVLDGLRDDFDWSGKNNWLIASTRLEYNGNDLNARIIQHYKCSNSDLVKECNIEVPVYRGVPVTQVVSDSKGLAYLQALLDTNDDGEVIMKTLEFVSGKNRNEIIIWTTDSSNRGSVPNRAAGFNYGGGLFHVYGYDSLDYYGRSRGVLDNPVGSALENRVAQNNHPEDLVDRNYHSEHLPRLEIDDGQVYKPIKSTERLPRLEVD